MGSELKLTVSQVAARLDVSANTIKRWYKWYEELSSYELSLLMEQGMPALPTYETLGNTGWRCWSESSIEEIERFKDWVPATKNGVFQKHKKMMEE